MRPTQWASNVTASLSMMLKRGLGLVSAIYLLIWGVIMALKQNRARAKMKAAIKEPRLQSTRRPSLTENALLKFSLMMLPIILVRRAQPLKLTIVSRLMSLPREFPPGQTTPLLSLPSRLRTVNREWPVTSVKRTRGPGPLVYLLTQRQLSLRARTLSARRLMTIQLVVPGRSITQQPIVAHLRSRPLPQRRLS